HLLGLLAHQIAVAGGPVVVQVHVRALGPAERRQSLAERGDAGLAVGEAFGGGHQHADLRDPVWLLRARAKRPGGRAGDEADERATSHAVTSPARTSGGIDARDLTIPCRRSAFIAPACRRGACPHRAARAESDRSGSWTAHWRATRRSC